MYFWRSTGRMCRRLLEGEDALRKVGRWASKRVLPARINNACKHCEAQYFGPVAVCAKQIQLAAAEFEAQNAAALLTDAAAGKMNFS